MQEVAIEQRRQRWSAAGGGRALVVSMFRTSAVRSRTRWRKDSSMVMVCRRRSAAEKTAARLMVVRNIVSGRGLVRLSGHRRGRRGM